MKLDVVVGVIVNANHNVLITQRSVKGSHPSDWEFPGGKVEKNERIDLALVRELNEEVNIKATKAKLFMTHEHQYDAYHVTLHAFLVTAYHGLVRCNENQQGYRWVALSELNQYTFPAANEPLIKQLKNMKFQTFSETSDE